MLPYNLYETPNYTSNRNYGAFYQTTPTSRQSAATAGSILDQLHRPALERIGVTTNADYGAFMRLVAVEPQGSRWCVHSDLAQVGLLPRTSVQTVSSDHYSLDSKFSYRLPPISFRAPTPAQSRTLTNYQDLRGAMRYGSQSFQLPDIEAIELHMKDKSRVLFRVHEFYKLHL